MSPKSRRVARVLLLCEYPTLCGGEMSMLSTFDAVEQAGFEIVVAAPPIGSLAGALRRRGISTVALSCWDESGTRRSLEDLRGELARTIEKVQPDLLHANSLSMGRLSGPVAAESCLPSMAHLRDIVRLSRTAQTDLNRHTRLLAVSDAVRQFHFAAGLSDQRMVVLHNGVDLDQFQPGSPNGFLHRELNLPPEVPLIGTIGQISLRKGTDVLLEAARQVVRQNDRVHFLLVGACHSTKDEALQLEALVHAAGHDGELAGRFHLLGIRDDVSAILRELTMLLHPARQEPLGRVLLEAAASGVPIVATRVGGTEEIFPPATTAAGSSADPASSAAILVEPDQSEALALASITLLEDEGKRQQLSQAARLRATEAFDVQWAAAALIEHYHDVMDADAASTRAP